MKRTLILAMALLAGLVTGCDRDAGTLEVTGAWVRAVSVMPGGMDGAEEGSEGMPAGPTTAAYLTIANSTGKDERLLAAFTPNAANAEIHESVMVDDVMSMRPVERVEIPAGESVSLEPGGLHIMLVGVYEALEAGQTLPLTLVFEQAGSLTVQAEVREP